MIRAAIFNTVKDKDNSPVFEQFTLKTIIQKSNTILKYGLVKVIKYVRLFSDENGDSRFGEVEVPLGDSGPIGYLSDRYEVKDIQFRINDADYDWDFHNAPARQFIILLDGEIEITTSLGEIRKFSGGDILLVEDTTGKGHRTRNVRQQVRRSVFIRLAGDNSQSG